MATARDGAVLTLDDVSEFETLEGKLEGLYTEALTLSKKSPSDLLNKFKLKMANSILAAANQFLAKKDLRLPVEEFDRFDDSDVPSNSDVVFVFSQYIQVFEKFRADSIQLSRGEWVWIVDGKPSGPRTAPPKKIDSK